MLPPVPSIPTSGWVAVPRVWLCLPKLLRGIPYGFFLFFTVLVQYLCIQSKLGTKQSRRHVIGFPPLDYVGRIATEHQIPRAGTQVVKQYIYLYG